jgi:hypothetical protein
MISRTASRLTSIVAGLALISAPVVAAASAYADPATDTVVAVDTTPAPAAVPTPTLVRTVIGIDANFPKGLTVTGVGKDKVTVSAPGQKPRTAVRTAAGTVAFRNLVAGKTYTVSVAGKKVGTAVPLEIPGRAYGLTVSTTTAADEVLLRWSQQPVKAQGSITYEITATPITSIGSTAATNIVSGTTSESVATMILDPAERYTFAVTPRNSAGAGTPSTAAMTKPLRELKVSTQAPVEPTPNSPAAPTAPATSTPAPAPSGPSTKTIYVCPGGYTETGGGVCEKSLAYTYTTVAYTYHSEPIYGYGHVGWAYSWGYCTGSGKSGNWSNGDPYCQTPVYGNDAIVGYQNVKDATPTGFTDTGSVWTAKDQVPAGYADNGTEWITTAAKVAQVVPA